MRPSKTVLTTALLLTVLPAAAVALELPVTVTHADTGAPVPDAVVSVNTGKEPEPVEAEIYQKDRAFHPRVLVVPEGSSVDFPNRDNTQHHVYSFSPAKTFNIELYAGRPEAPVVFDKPGIVELGCNIHDHMQGFVVVTNSTAVARTDGTGRATLELPALPGDRQPGMVELQVWHPRLPDNTGPVIRQVPIDKPVAVSLDLIPEPAAGGSLDLLQQRFEEL